MSALGQTEKNSVRAYVFRFALNDRTRSRGRALAGRSGHYVYRSNYLIERR
jgi:hypothetical protein